MIPHEIKPDSKVEDHYLETEQGENGEKYTVAEEMQIASG